MQRTTTLIGVAVLAAAIHAQTVTVEYDAGTTNTTSALSGFNTGGDDMDGMRVTAFFADTSSETVSWATIGFNAGRAAGTGWSLSLSGGTTFSFPFLLSNFSGQAVTRLLIDAGPGDAVFDTTAVGNVFGTNGSASGRSFTLLSGADYLDILATYRDAVALTGFSPVGDLFRFLDIEFLNATALPSGTRILFYSDTDNLLFAGDLNAPPKIECSEPAVLWAPNHDLHDVSSAFSVTDPDDDAFTVSIRIFCDEPELDSLTNAGNGSGQHSPDAKDETGANGRGLLVRAERQGTGDGRWYIAVITATDSNQASTTKVCVLAVVPHDGEDPADVTAVKAEAEAARAAIETAVTNIQALPMAGTFEVGSGPVVGPKQ